MRKTGQSRSISLYLLFLLMADFSLTTISKYFNKNPKLLLPHQYMLPPFVCMPFCTWFQNVQQSIQAPIEIVDYQSSIP